MCNSREIYYTPRSIDEVFETALGILEIIGEYIRVLLPTPSRFKKRLLTQFSKRDRLCMCAGTGEIFQFSVSFFTPSLSLNEHIPAKNNEKPNKIQW